MPVTYMDIQDANDTGQRLDNFLMRVLKGVPRSHVYKILRSGEVRVNGGRVKPTYRLQPGDRVRVPPVTHRSAAPVRVSERSASQLRDAVLYEDEDFLILDKPHGLAVHGGSSVSAGVVEMLRKTTGNARIELIHRLDRDTSGCLALAKNRPALRTAQAAFRGREVKKIYQLYVWGAWPGEVRSVHLRLKRYVTAWGERRVRVDSSGQSARTDFSILEQGARLTCLEAALHTGRTHQIRVHAVSSGHPIVGDDKYGRDAQSAELASGEFRLCLHAHRLAIPLGSDVLKVQAAVPDDMQAIWSALNRREADPGPGN